MKIYPTLYRYNAPYRGPRSYRELNKVLTSIGHDISKAKEANLVHSEAIETNIRFCNTKDGTEVSNFNSSAVIGEETRSFQPLNEIRKKINSMDDKLDNILKNI
jgi:hypothetical protein